MYYNSVNTPGVRSQIRTPSKPLNRRTDGTASRIQRVRVTLRPTVSRSVSLGVEPRLGHMTRYYVLLDSYGFVSLAPSLTRGRVCHLSLSLSVYCQSLIHNYY
jgi:hypothetical protein